MIHAAQPVVIDTGLGLPDRDFVASVSAVIDPLDVRWIWLTQRRMKALLVEHAWDVGQAAAATIAPDHELADPPA